MPPVFSSGAQLVDGVVQAPTPGSDVPPSPVIPAPASPVVEDVASAPELSTDAGEHTQPQAEELPPEGEEPEAEEQLVLPPTNRGQRRFVSNLIRENERARAELESLRQQQALLIQRFSGQPSPQPQTPVPPPAPMGPRREDYPDEASYIDAVVDLKLRQRDEQQTLQQKSTIWQDRMGQGAKQYADFDAVINNPAANPSPSLSPVLFEAVCESEAGHELLYALGRDLALLNRLNRMTPTGAAREIGRLEEVLKAQRQAPPRQAPPAPRTPTPTPPAPLRQPVSGGGAPAPVGGFRPGMGVRDYAKMRQQERANR